jgi:hypothetical protein
MLVFNFSLKKKKFVKLRSTSFIKIAASGLAVALVLAFSLFSRFMPARTDSINTEASLWPAASGDTDISGSVSNQPLSTRPSNELLPDSQYVPGSALVGRSLVYTATGKPASERKPLTFTIAATDADGDQLVYSASNLPDGASFDPDTRTFSWTPRYDQAGVYSVRFEVSDGSLTDSEDITITVVQPSADWDVNGDGAANVLDLVLVGQRWGESGLTGWIREDANEDGTVDVLDMIVIGQHWTP